MLQRIFFFFSSRRRHTRCSRDWSSDVCSSDLLVALYDLATGTQRWVSESLFQQTEQKRGGLGGLMQGLVRMASAATTLEVLQAGPDVIVVHTLMGLRALDAKTGAIRWTAT